MSLIDNIKKRLSGESGESRMSGESRDGLAVDADDCCRLIVGLGNPGERYTTTRHNAGFWAIDSLADKLDVDNWRPGFDSLYAEKKIKLGDESLRLVLAKPQTLMNLSGRAVKGLLKHYKLDLEELCVIQDDIDLDSGVLRVKLGGGHGGHNGIRDIIAAVGSDYIRIKIGVGAPPGRMDSADYVLQQLKGDALEEFQIDTSRAADAALFLLEHTLTETQNQFN